MAWHSQLRDNYQYIFHRHERFLVFLAKVDYLTENKNEFCSFLLGTLGNWILMSRRQSTVYLHSCQFGISRYFIRVKLGNTFKIYNTQYESTKYQQIVLKLNSIPIQDALLDGF